MKHTFICVVLCIIYIFLLSRSYSNRPSRLDNTGNYSCHIVVARYNEDVSWTNVFTQEDLFIYNKGSSLNVPTIGLPNVGREGHSYFHHIVNHYENLPDAIICLQGNPFDHSPHAIETIDRLFNKKRPRSFFYISESIKDNGLDGSWWHYNLHSWWYKLPHIPKELPKKIYQLLFDDYPKDTYRFTYGTGAQFMVSRQRIRKRPKSFYEKIVCLLESSNNPLEGFIIERFYPLIFNSNLK
jgi:hypothetical protein